MTRRHTGVHAGERALLAWGHFLAGALLFTFKALRRDGVRKVIGKRSFPVPGGRSFLPSQSNQDASLAALTGFGLWGLAEL